MHHELVVSRGPWVPTGCEVATEMLQDAGFNSEGLHRLPHDLLNELYVVRP